MKLQVSRIDVVEFLRRTAMSFESWAERKKIDLEFRSEIDSASGFIDTDKLEKILNNLMSNALKFTPDGGAVVVSCGQLHPPPARGVHHASLSLCPTPVPALPLSIFPTSSTASTVPMIPTRPKERGSVWRSPKELVELHHGRIDAREHTRPGIGVYGNPADRRVCVSAGRDPGVSPSER